ncbi:hypothetical protein CFIMG_007533RA00001 [Ceratocystis fimbriata CBS 114723]|uniref:Uncharacterized protein n=1 Tax=Ceratocystis fimbriata CBS 114723 TaxID=1035309 RepID=A0A2C5XFD5_9PEZI|nr:hypothetical protein CFIMG_007533RA00001 [Ceratocystis fimbriata CBS 114723]
MRMAVCTAVQEDREEAKKQSQTQQTIDWAIPPGLRRFYSMHMAAAALTNQCTPRRPPIFDGNLGFFRGTWLGLSSLRACSGY